MALASEFLTYLFKYIVLGAIAIIGVLCGVKYKKNKLNKEDTAAGDNAADAQ